MPGRPNFFRCRRSAACIKIPGMEIFHRLTGRGPTLVFNHGWTMTHRFFERQQVLSDRFQILVWDLPGHGDSEKSESGYSLADCSAALRDLLGSLGLSDVVGVGWSMGAQVLWDYVGRYGPAPFVRLVNVESVPWGDPDRYQVPGVTQSFQRDRPRAARKFVKNMFFHPPAPETLDWMVEESLRTPTPIALKYYQEIAHADFREAFRKASIPVASLLSRHGALREEAPKLEALRPKDPIQWFEASGHMPFWEEADKFNAWLGRHLDRG